jgi:hypothetical protein
LVHAYACFVSFVVNKVYIFSGFTIILLLTFLAYSKHLRQFCGFDKVPDDSPDEDKSVHDLKLLIPTLKDFFDKHPLINPKTFLGDAAFDTLPLYKQLLTGDTFGINQHFSSAYIPLNKRSSLENSEVSINENGSPYCPNNPSFPLKKEVRRLRNAKTRIIAVFFLCKNKTTPH